MHYTIKAHPTLYRGVEFRSRLEATWAAFFDLAKWHWEYEPIDLNGWVPDFYVKFPCHHSECNGSHDLYVEVKPFRYIEEFKQLPIYRTWDDPVGWGTSENPALAFFGLNPDVSEWGMGHGAGGGVECVDGWVRNTYELWKKAQNITRWSPR